MNTNCECCATGLEISAWVRRWAHLVEPGQRLLDYACGTGRHARYFGSRGVAVLAVDRDARALEELAGLDQITVREMDLEGQTWPLLGERFDAVLVSRYLHRRRFPELMELLSDTGVLIYETFARGNELLGRPSNPEFLLEDDELLALTRERLRVVAFEQGRVETPRPAVLQRLVGVGRSRPWPVALNSAAERP